jgi:hypothetical protein
MSRETERGMRVRTTIGAATAILMTACAGSPGPGQSGYPYNVDGLYAGRLTVEDQRFDATLQLETARGGRVRGSFTVSAPLEIEGRVNGMLVDDLLRLTLSYASADRSAGRACTSSIEGILNVERGGAVVDGPITITDCGDALPGRMSFRRQP